MIDYSKAIELLRDGIDYRTDQGDWLNRAEQYLRDYDNAPRPEASAEARRLHEEYRKTISRMVVGDGGQTR